MKKNNDTMGMIKSRQSRRIMGYVLYWKEGAALHHAWFPTKYKAYEFAELRNLNNKITNLRPEYDERENPRRKSDIVYPTFNFRVEYKDSFGRTQQAFFEDRSSALDFIEKRNLDENFTRIIPIHHLKENPTWEQIDNNHYIISGKLAGQLGGSLLPRFGREKLVTYEGKNYWLKKLPYKDKLVWMLHGPTPWKMQGETAILGNPPKEKFILTGRGPRGQVFRKYFNTEKEARNVIALKNLKQAVINKMQHNPPMTKIYSECIEVRASKAGIPHQCDAACKRSGHNYKHAFRKKACVYGLPDGSILIK